jgi:hypothetical protein
MAAVVVPSSRPRSSCPPRSPGLRVIVGGRDPALRLRRTRRRAVYRRRRVLVALGAAVMVAMVWLAAVGAASLLRPAGAPASDAPTAAVAADAPTVHVVRPGDTLWSIARALEPDGDLRAVVDRLADRAGGSGLQPGQRIDLDGLVG